MADQGNDHSHQVKVQAQVVSAQMTAEEAITTGSNRRIIKIIAVIAVPLWLVLGTTVFTTRHSLTCLSSEPIDTEGCETALKADKVQLLRPVVVHKLVGHYEGYSEYSKAIDILKMEVERDPSPRLLSRLAFMHEWNEDYAAAADVFLRTHRAKPDDIEVWSHAVKNLAYSDRTSEATTIANAFVTGHSNKAESWEWLGWLQSNQNKFAEAAASYAKANSFSPTNAEYVRLQGWNLELNKDYPAALASYGKAIAIDKSPSSLDSRIQLFEKLGRLREAEADYEALLKLSPTIWNRYAFAQFLINNRGAQGEARARLLLDGVLKEDDTYFSAWELSIRLHIRQGRFDAAKEGIERLRKNEYAPEDADYWTARLDEASGNYPQAIRGYKKLLERFTGWNRLRGDIGEALVEMKTPQAALSWFDAAIRERPEQAEGYVSRARAYIHLKLPDAALRDADRALSIDPFDGIAHARRAQALEMQGKMDDALGAYAKAFEYEPFVAWIKDDYAAMLEKQGKEALAKSVRAAAD